MLKLSENLIQLDGCQDFRVRLVLATLSGKAIKISHIRSHDLNPGLRDFEVSFLRLIDAVTNGSHIEISYTGTTVLYSPGIIIGGDVIHNCPHSKPIGYFLEWMLCLAPFSKKKFSLLFKGLTASTESESPGVDSIKWGLLPVIEKFGVREAAIHILKRGSPPLGGGEVLFTCNTLLTVPLTLHALEASKFSAIRGVAYCTRVSPSTVNRVIEGARKVLKPTQVDTNITADVWRGEDAGRSPGYGVTLVAELKKGWRVVAEGTGASGTLPEDLGEEVAYKLLYELKISGVLGRNQMLMALSYMAVGREDIGRLKIHKMQIDEHFVQHLREIKKIFGLEAFLKDEAESPISEDKDYMTVTLRGIGFANVSKRSA